MSAWEPSTPSDQLGGGLAAPLTQIARGGDPKTPRGLLAHLFLGAWAPHVALRARLPLFRFRPPPPCLWAAAMVAAGLLPCCWCLLVNADTLPCLVPCAAAAWPPRALVLASRDMRALCFLLRARWAAMAGYYLRVAAPWCRRPTPLWVKCLCASFGQLHILAHPPEVAYWRHVIECVARPATCASEDPWSQSNATSVSHLLA